jgi:thiol-disulfide isomerase/thioredoxin
MKARVPPRDRPGLAALPVGLLSAALLITTGCDARAPRRPRPAPTAQASAATTEAPAAVEGASPIDGPGLRELLRAQLKQAGHHGALVNVWASWCGSCKRELPMLLEMREAFLPQGLDVLFVSADTREKWPDAVSFAKQAGLPLPMLVIGGSLGPWKRAISPRWRGAIPALFLFDVDATLRHRWEGPIYEHELAPVLQAYLAGENVDGETLPAVSEGKTGP